jgi:hypothetical protein
MERAGGDGSASCGTWACSGMAMMVLGRRCVQHVQLCSSVALKYMPCFQLACGSTHHWQLLVLWAAG